MSLTEMCIRCLRRSRTSRSSTCHHSSWQGCRTCIDSSPYMTVDAMAGLATLLAMAMATHLPTAMAMLDCRSSASTGSTVRTRPGSDDRSTGRIRATCPQSYSPREVAPSRAMVQARVENRPIEGSWQGSPAPACNRCTLLHSDGRHPGTCQTRSRCSRSASPMPCTLLQWAPSQ